MKVNVVLDPVEETNTCNPYSELKNLLDNTKISQSVEPICSDAAIISTKPTFKENNSKVVVLENKVLKSVDIDRDERRKAIDAKLQKCKTSMSKSKSQRFSSQKSIRNASFKVDTHQKKQNGDEPDKNDSLSSQDLNMHQEYSFVLSQESQKSSQPTENTKPVGLGKAQANSKLKMKLSQSVNQRLSEMKFIPQQQKSIFSTEQKVVGIPRAVDKRGFEMNFPGECNFINVKS